MRRPGAPSCSERSGRALRTSAQSAACRQGMFPTCTAAAWSMNMQKHMHHGCMLEPVSCGLLSVLSYGVCPFTCVSSWHQQLMADSMSARQQERAHRSLRFHCFPKPWHSRKPSRCNEELVDERGNRHNSPEQSLHWQPFRSKRDGVAASCRVGLWRPDVCPERPLGPVESPKQRHDAKGDVGAPRRSFGARPHMPIAMV